MRIVHIEDFFIPNAGYQLNLLAKYQSKYGHEVIIVSAKPEKGPKHLTSFFGINEISEGDIKFNKKYNVKIIRVDIFTFYSGRAIYKSSLYRLIKELKPDLLYVHGNDSFAGIMFTLKYRDLGFPVIYDNHMLEMATKNPFNKIFRKIYKFFITPIIIRNKLKVLRVVDDPFVQNNLGIPVDLSPVLPLGTDTINFFPSIEARYSFRGQLNLPPNTFIVLYAGKLDRSKGGQFLVNSLIEEIKPRNGKEIVFLIVGNSTLDNYGVEMDNIILKSKNKIIRFPTQKYDDLPKFYQCSDLVLFPKQCSLSFFDAQACGLPALIERNVINIERVRYNNGFLFSSENIHDFRNKIQHIAEIEGDEMEIIRQSSVEYINRMGLDYNIIIELYEKIINEVRDDYFKIKR